MLLVSLDEGNALLPSDFMVSSKNSFWGRTRMRTNSIRSILGAIVAVLASLAVIGGQDQRVWAQETRPAEWETVVPPPPIDWGWRWNVWKPQNVEEVHVHPHVSSTVHDPIANAFRKLEQRCVGRSAGKPTMRYYSLFTPGRVPKGLLGWLLPPGPGPWEFFFGAKRTENPAPNFLNSVVRQYGDIVVIWAKPTVTPDAN